MKFPLIRMIQLAVLCIGAGGFAAGAKAQDIEARPTKFSVKLGIFQPTQGGMMNTAGRHWYDVGFDFFPKYKTGPTTDSLYFGMDFYWRSSGGQNTFSIPVLAKYRKYLSPLGARPRWYVGVGGGLYFVNAKNLSSTVQPGVRGIFGVDITHKFFLELNYDYVSGFSNNLGVPLRADGFAVSAGVKF